jgi:catechol 2,3-dioxygenase-like lactoylglutathione lyase family enzyme
VASDIADIDEGDRLVAVRVAIENTSGMPISINPLNLTLLDENGIVHEAELGALEGLDQLSTFTLYTNERVAGWVSFAVEEGMSPATVKFSESIISAEGVTDDVTNIEVPEWEPIAEEPATNLGDTVSGLGVELTSLVVTDPAQASSFYTAEEGVHIVAVEVRLRNADASDTVSANPFYFYLVDNLGFVHTAELGSTAQEQIAPRDLASGEAVEGVIGFEVPDGRTPLYIRYAANFFDDTEFLEVGLTE